MHFPRPPSPAPGRSPSPAPARPPSPAPAPPPSPSPAPERHGGYHHQGRLVRDRKGKHEEGGRILKQACYQPAIGSLAKQANKQGKTNKI